MNTHIKVFFSNFFEKNLKLDLLQQDVYSIDEFFKHLVCDLAIGSPVGNAITF